MLSEILWAGGREGVEGHLELCIRLCIQENSEILLWKSGIEKDVEDPIPAIGRDMFPSSLQHLPLMSLTLLFWLKSVCLLIFQHHG